MRERYERWALEAKMWSTCLDLAGVALRARQHWASPLLLFRRPVAVVVHGGLIRNEVAVCDIGLRLMLAGGHAVL